MRRMKSNCVCLVICLAVPASAAAQAKQKVKNPYKRNANHHAKINVLDFNLKAILKHNMINTNQAFTRNRTTLEVKAFIVR